MKAPYKFPCKSRGAMVDYICGIGGYFTGSVYTRDHWPIEFNVALYYADLDFDHLWSIMVKEGMDSVDHPLFKNVACAEYTRIKGRLWEEAQERLVEQLDEEHVTRLWDGTDLGIKLSLAGRGGKHLVVEEALGWKMRGWNTDDLRQMLLEQTGPEEDVYEATLRRGYSWSTSIERVRKLYQFCVQATVEFTPRKASDTLEYEAASILNGTADSALADAIKDSEDKAANEAAARDLYEGFADREGDATADVAAWRRLAVAAGVDISKIIVDMEHVP